MLIPEVVIINLIESFFKYVSDDYTINVGDETKSVLYDLFNTDDNGQPLVIGNYNYFKQSKELVLRTSQSARKIEAALGYNMARASSPSIHILMPNESKGKMDSIGDLSYQPEQIVGNKLVTTKSRSSSAIFHLLITSDNSSEVILVYYFLRGMFIMFSEHLELSGFKDVQFTGGDINMFQEFGPPNIFSRNLSLSFTYSNNVKVKSDYNDATAVTAALCPDFATEANEYLNNHTEVS